MIISENLVFLSFKVVKIHSKIHFSLISLKTKMVAMETNLAKKRARGHMFFFLEKWPLWCLLWIKTISRALNTGTYKLPFLSIFLGSGSLTRPFKDWIIINIHVEVRNVTSYKIFYIQTFVARFMGSEFMDFRLHFLPIISRQKFEKIYTK